MTWAQIIAEARRPLQDESNSFYSPEMLKIYGLECQRQIASRAWILFPFERTFATVANQEMYTFDNSIGADAFALKRLMYGNYTDIFPMEFYQKPMLGQKSLPSCFFMRSGSIGFCDTPNAVETITAWGYSTPPLETLYITHDGSASATAATVTISGNTLTLTITGGTNANTYPIVLTAAATDTIAEVVTAINALAVGFTATRPTDVYSGEISKNLEGISATSCLNTTLSLYQNPQIPMFCHRHLVNGIRYKAFEESGAQAGADRYEKKWDNGLVEIEFEANQQGKSFRLGNIVDVYQGHADNIFPAPGGWFVRIP